MKSKVVLIKLELYYVSSLKFWTESKMKFRKGTPATSLCTAALTHGRHEAHTQDFAVQFSLYLGPKS